MPNRSYIQIRTGIQRRQTLTQVHIMRRENDSTGGMGMLVPEFWWGEKRRMSKQFDHQLPGLVLNDSSLKKNAILLRLNILKYFLLHSEIKSLIC